MDEAELKRMQHESALRRKAHRNWPSHKTSLIIPGEPEKIYETMPIGKSDDFEGYCKYCYTTHRNWWLMDPRENIDGDNMLLCGLCEHTSLQGFTNIVPDYTKTKASKEMLKIIVSRHTRYGSQHQAQALKMLDSHYKRFIPEIKAVTCSKCNNTSFDCVRWTDKKSGRIVDSWGYIEAGSNICYRCDGAGGYIGDIYGPPG